MDKFNFTELSIDELDQLIPALVQRRKELVDKRRAELVAELERLGGLPKQIKPQRAKKRPEVQRAPAYRDEQGNYWPGKGRAPKWLRDHEAAGRHRSQFAIEKPTEVKQ